MLSDEEFNKLREQKEHLEKELANWEETFKKNAKRDPTKQDIKKRTRIADMYKEYDSVKDIVERNKLGRSFRLEKRVDLPITPESEPVSPSAPSFDDGDKCFNSSAQNQSEESTGPLSKPSTTTQDSGTDIQPLPQPQSQPQPSSAAESKSSSTTLSCSEELEKLEQQRSRLSKELRSWEKSFRSETQRDPTKQDIKMRPQIANLYREYTSLKQAMTQKKAMLLSLSSDISDPLVASDPKPESSCQKEPTTTESSKQDSKLQSQKESTAKPRSSLPPAEKLSRLQERKARLAKELINWEKSFKETHKRDRTMDDLKNAPEIGKNIHEDAYPGLLIYYFEEQLYKDYKGLKAYLERKTTGQSSRSSRQVNSQAETESARIHACEITSSSQPILPSDSFTSNAVTGHTDLPSDSQPQTSAVSPSKTATPVENKKQASTTTQPKATLITKSLSYHAGVTQEEAFWTDAPSKEYAASQPVPMSEEEAFWLEPRKPTRKTAPLWPVSNPFSRGEKRRNSDADIDNNKRLPLQPLRCKKNRAEKSEHSDEDLALSDDKENIDPNSKQTSPEPFEDPFADFPLGKDIIVVPHHREPARTCNPIQRCWEDTNPRFPYHVVRATVVRPYFANPRLLAQAKKELEAGTYGQVRKPEIQDALVDDDVKQFRKDNHVPDEFIWEL
ncbi:hypothetical protein DFQ28_002559 [Apophysomyces sp. BC1034]|nr:hypothetical protein DFQ28_002559 [Apophysomyces sp. BC1034]